VRYCARIGVSPAEFEAWAKNTQRISALTWLGCWPGHANMSQGRKFDSAALPVDFMAA
jgi:hypothetical protein